MKLTESRIKQIIQEELERVNEEQPPEQPPDDETKTLAALKKFMLQKAKETGQLSDTSTNEVRQIAELVDLMFSIVGKGEVSRFLEYAKEQLKKKAGIK